MRIGPQLEAQWSARGEQKADKYKRVLELIDFSGTPATRIEMDERAARMLAALIHVEFEKKEKKSS